MTSRSLNIINDTRNNLSGTQLRSNVVPIIELSGDKQALTNSTSTNVLFTETLRQIGTENVNYVWPVVSYTLLPPQYIYRWDLIKITVSGYYSFQFQYRLDTITEMYVTLITYALADVVLFLYDQIRYSTQLAPVNNEGVVTWTQYINANEVVSIAVNPAANVNLILGNQMRSPSLTIVQLSQYYTDVIGYKSTIAITGGTQVLTTAVSAQVVFNQTQGASNAFSGGLDVPSVSEYNQGGSNQLGLAEPTYSSYYILTTPDSGIYYIEAAIVMTGTTGVGTGGRFLMIVVNGVVVASQYLEPNATAPRNINVSVAWYLMTGDVVSVWARQTSGVNQTISSGHFTIMRMG